MKYTTSSIKGATRSDMISDTQLSELLITKVCHDLSGPVGAINNGVELLKEGSADIQERSIELVEASAKEAVARVLFFRQAYGLTYTDSELNVISTKTIADDFLKQKKVTIDWSGMQEGKYRLTSEFGKLLLNLMVVLSAMLIHGGTIKVRLDSPKTGALPQITIVGSGDIVKIDPEAVQVLMHEPQDSHVTLKNVQAYALARLIEKLGAQFSMNNQGATSVEMSVR